MTKCFDWQKSIIVFILVFSVYRERTLQTVTNWFIVSLAFADLFVTIPMVFSLYVMVRII